MERINHMSLKKHSFSIGHIFTYRFAPERHINLGDQRNFQALWAVY